jgi:HSP20 family protein
MPEVKSEKSSEQRTPSTERTRSGALTHPFNLMRRLTEEMERAFSTSFGLIPSFSRYGMSDQNVWAPQIEIYEKDNHLVVIADLPGMKKEDLKVQLTNDALVIEGERRHEHEERHGGRCHTERSYGRFYRSIPVPEGTDSTKIQAQFRDGVLEVRVPFLESHHTQAQEIPIRA